MALQLAVPIAPTIQGEMYRNPDMGAASFITWDAPSVPAIGFNIYCGDVEDHDADNSYFPVYRDVPDVTARNYLALPLVDEAMTWYGKTLINLRCWVSSYDATRAETWVPARWQFPPLP